MDAPAVETLPKAPPAPVVPPLREVKKEDILTSEFSKKLGELTVEATAKFKVEDWVKVSEGMVKLLNAFPEWNGAVLQSLDTVFTKGLEEVTKKGDEVAKQEFINRFHGWVGEASFIRLYNRLGVGKLQTDPEMDKNGVDAMAVLRELKRSYYVFFNVKALRGIEPGVIVFNPDKSGYYQPIPGIRNGTHTMDEILRERKTYERFLSTTPPGNIKDFCRTKGQQVRNIILEKNPEINPDEHTSHILLLVAGIGMEPQDEERYYGWKEVMKMVELDKEGDHPLLKGVRADILALLSTAEELPKKLQ